MNRTKPVALKKAFLLFIFILLFSLSFSTSTNGLEQRFSSLESSSNPVVAFFSDWRGLAITGLIIGVALSALFYMGGELFDINLLRYYFKVEIKDVFANALLIVIFVAILSLIDLGSNQLNCSSGFCFDDKVISFLNNSFEEPLRENIKQINYAIESRAIQPSVHVGIESILAGYMSFGSGLTFYYTNYHLIPVRDAMENAYGLLIAFIYALKLSSSLLGPLFISIGLLLRSFFFTKRLGSNLFSLGIGLLAFFPFIAYIFYSTFLMPLATNNVYEEQCPSMCKDSVVGYYSGWMEGLEPLTSSSFARLIENRNLDYEEVEGFLNGTIESIDSHNPSIGTIYSCEYAALQNAEVIEGLYDEDNGFPHGLYCFPECRESPYPDDVIQCRDAESKCKELYISHDEYYNSYEVCFKKNYAYPDTQEYQEILSLYAVLPDEYEQNCPIECRDIPNLKPKDKSDIYNIFCPTRCREIYVDVDFDPSSGEFSYSNIRFYDNKGWQSSECTTLFSCGDYYGFSSQEELESDVNNSLEHRGIKSFYEVKIVPKGEAKNKCKPCYNYPKGLQSYPIIVDCSMCIKNIEVPDLRKDMQFSYSSVQEVGKIIFLSYGIPLAIIITTLYSIAGLASYIGGDMFLPAINKLIPR